MRVLFTVQPSVGHLHPLVPVADALVEAGHQVAVCTAKSFAPEVDRFGLEHIEAGLDWLAADHATWTAFPPMPPPGPEFAGFVVAVFADVTAQHMVPDVLRIAQDWRPDLIVREHFEHGGYLTAEVLGIPHVSIGGNAYSAIDSPDVRYFAGNRMMLSEPMARHRIRLGLPGDPDVRMPYRHLHVSFTPPSWDGADVPRPPNLCHFRHESTVRRGARLPAWAEGLGRRPTVFASLGTVFNTTPGILEAIIEALAGEPLDLIVAVGRNVDASRFGSPPDNVRLEPHVDQPLLLERCDAFVTHGGFNSVKEAAILGVPMVVLPITADQPYGAGRCAALGIGRAIAPADRSTRAIRVAVREVLEEPGYRDRARLFQAEMRALPGREALVSALEATVRTSEAATSTRSDRVVSAVGGSMGARDVGPSCPASPDRSTRDAPARVVGTMRGDPGELNAEPGSDHSTQRPAGLRLETQVLVVGAGPAGLVAAITLAHHGIDVLVVEKRADISTLSRTLVISTRGMELMRGWGLEEAVLAGAAGVEPRAWVTENLASAEGHEMPLGYPTAEEAARVSPTRATWVAQDHHEPILLRHLQTLPPAVTRFQCELVDLRQRESAVEATLHDLRTDATYEVRATFAVAADGAHSTVRDRVGLRLVGPDDLAEFHRVEFTAPLFDIVGERRFGLYVITDPTVAGVFAPRGRGLRWGLSREWTPGQERLDQHSESELIALISRGAGIPRVPAHIERITSFAFAAQIADGYRRDRCFLVRDAAHRMTPRGGTGMNTAIQDAFDLGWKLAWVLRGWAPDALLDSYETERRPVGLHNVRRAGEPTGARRTADDALPWDLNGRLAHHWIDRGDERVSTLDLIGPGLTLLASEAEPLWRHPAEDIAAPVTVHVLDAATRGRLGLASRGALLARPDAHEVCRWSAYDPRWAQRGLEDVSCRIV